LVLELFFKIHFVSFWVLIHNLRSFFHLNNTFLSQFTQGKFYNNVHHSLFHRYNYLSSNWLDSVGTEIYLLFLVNKCPTIKRFKWTVIVIRQENQTKLSNRKNTFFRTIRFFFYVPSSSAINDDVKVNFSSQL